MAALLPPEFGGGSELCASRWRSETKGNKRSQQTSLLGGLAAQHPAHKDNLVLFFTLFRHHPTH
jgi:hypothetical protein